MNTPEPVADIPCRRGDVPLWHPEEKRLYWSDVAAGRLYRLDPASGIHELCHEGRPVGGMTLQADGSLLLFRDQGNIVVWREGRIAETIVHGLAELRHTRFTAAAADPCGRVFCGTLSGRRRVAGFHRLDLSGRLTLLCDICGTPAGVGFAAGARALLLNDVHASRNVTWIFDYDADEGTLSNRRVFRDGSLADDPGCPAGLALDSEGGVWTARWNGGTLLRHEPSAGGIAARVPLPVRRPTALCFGGENLADLFVATAGGHRRPADGVQAGALFRLRGLPCRGLPPHVSRLGRAAAAQHAFAQAGEAAADEERTRKA
jgi:sugar lactone lactonase YvrE